jgi:hypothetical protein
MVDEKCPFSKRGLLRLPEQPVCRLWWAMGKTLHVSTLKRRQALRKKNAMYRDGR